MTKLIRKKIKNTKNRIKELQDCLCLVSFRLCIFFKKEKVKQSKNKVKRKIEIFYMVNFPHTGYNQGDWKKNRNYHWTIQNTPTPCISIFWRINPTSLIKKKDFNFYFSKKKLKFSHASCWNCSTNSSC